MSSDIAPALHRGLGVHEWNLRVKDYNDVLLQVSLSTVYAEWREMYLTAFRRLCSSWPGTYRRSAWQNSPCFYYTFGSSRSTSSPGALFIWVLVQQAFSISQLPSFLSSRVVLGKAKVDSRPWYALAASASSPSHMSSPSLMYCLTFIS